MPRAAEPPSSLRTEFFGVPRRKALLGGASLVECDYGAQIRLQPHRHDHANFCVILRGGFLDLARGRSTECWAPRVLYRPPGEEHAQQFGSEGARCLNVELPTIWTAQFGAERLIPERAVVLPEFGIPIALRLHHEFCHPDAMSELAVTGLLMEMFAISLREQSRRDARRAPEWLDAARRLCQATECGRRTVHEIAAAVGVHPRRLTRAFQQFERCSAANYIRLQHLRRACALLTQTDLPIGELALSAGYCDQSHLNREFRSALHLTPLAFRNANARKRSPVQ